jgi:hypothetical protein
MSYARFRDQLVNANRHDLYPPEWLDSQIAKGLVVPILGDQSAMVVGVRVYPSGLRVGHITAAAGDLEELRDIVGPRAAEWGREHGCRMAMLEGRPGWSRALKDHGWDHHQSVLLRDI